MSLHSSGKEIKKRPWGTFECILPSLENYQVKRLTVHPGHCLSLQKHKYREEHWFVVEGEGEAIVGEIKVQVQKGTIISVPVGTLHRLSNPSSSSENLTIIEIQLGSYLGEDDIERLEDLYGRI